MSDSKKIPREKFDAEFDAFLHEQDSRLAALYRKLPHAEPDATLDARVRAQARSALRRHDEAAARTMVPASRSRARRWLPAFGAAATLVLVASLAWRLIPPAAPTREAASMADANTSVAAQDEDAAMPAAPPPPSAPVAAQASAELPAAAAQTPPAQHGPIAAKPQFAAPADAAKAEAKPAANATSSAVPAREREAPPGNAEPAAFPPRLAKQARTRSATPSQPAAAAAPAPPPVEPAATIAMEAETARPAPASAAAPATVLGKAATGNRAATAQAFADRPDADDSAFVVEPDPSAPTRYRWRLTDDSAAAQARSGVYPPDPPPLRAWIAIVRAMLRDGHRDAARQALAELRARHPDFRVPSDLRGLE
ncbi:MAG: hypothetical protein JSS42_09635 [Proteobacteria bacterium]|uniref:hypothetical protein n=1 Tax=Rudaea sp. TaxID=2136325 RepID=UPI0032201644|nr:hypothetical protein [Pseudomonadota bacterium]